MRIACVNQDPGIAPGGKKGAAVHVASMREAFRRLGAIVLEIDTPDPEQVEGRLGGPGELDLIYERYALNGFAASRFARRHGVPHVLEVNSPLVDEARRFRPGTNVDVPVEAERLRFSGASLVLAVSTKVADYALARGARPECIVVAPNGVDSERFHPRSEHDPVRAEIVPEGSFVLGFHGRLRPWHNFELLVEATRRLVEAGVPAFLMTIGRGPFSEAIDGNLPSEAYACRDWVDHGEVGAYVACFDALPLTHVGDASFYFSPLKLGEAMAAGVVPVVPDLGDLPDAVEHMQQGLVYPSGDSDALVDALTTLVRRPALRGELAGAARIRAESNSWTSIARGVLEQTLERAR